VALPALIAGTVSYLHMHMLVARHGQPGWVAALTPLSVDGMIVAASTTLLADSRCGRNGGALPWALLVAGSVASLAANVAVAEPTLIGRVIAAWPSFALTASFELLTRQVRRGASTAPGTHAAAAARTTASGGTWGTAKEVPGIAALATDVSSYPLSVSCGAAGNCSAGGSYYTDSSGHHQAFVVSEKGGTWGTAKAVPGITALNQGGDAQIASVSCASAGHCSAVGFYTTRPRNGFNEAFVVNET
jgi:hypothetical protein